VARETEIKIPVTDLGEVRSCLEERGARRIHDSLRETNILLDDQERRLGGAGKALRLRNVGDRQVVTLKGPVSYDGVVKSRQELEVEVADTGVVEEILLDLGYVVVIRYEKDRERWGLDDMIVCLDHTPMGDFVEIEGPAGGLTAAAAAIGLDPTNAVRHSYLGLWAEHRRQRPELHLPADMVFDE
jgi:adenylate cyclase class 2